jgi:inhibitor of KinA sporulation pathway (predicted exonuclease)
MALKDQFGGTIILLDAEFTCWEGSLASGWNDPDRPAEMIEVGMIAYDAVRQVEIASYTSLLKPLKNQLLSEYCLNILPIRQSEIDKAPEFESVMSEIFVWLNHHASPDSPTAAWGKIDRTHTTDQTSRHNVIDPFRNRSHIEVDTLVKTALGIATQIEREDVRNSLGIQPIAGRHRALADSADLIAFDLALARMNK